MTSWRTGFSKRLERSGRPQDNGGQYTCVALASASRGVVAYRIDKRTRPSWTTLSKTFASAC
jgi:hypothetical protein